MRVLRPAKRDGVSGVFVTERDRLLGVFGVFGFCYMFEDGRETMRCNEFDWFRVINVENAERMRTAAEQMKVEVELEGGTNSDK